MSMCYWAISGLGFEIDESIFKEGLLDDDDNEIYNFSEFFEHYIDNANGVNTPIYCDYDGDGAHFILYTPRPIYNMGEIEKSFTCRKDIAKEMYRILEPYLKEEIDEQYFIDNLDYVSTYGCG